MMAVGDDEAVAAIAPVDVEVSPNGQADPAASVALAVGIELAG
ncbi:MAG TPA: hypothetical protein DEP69_05235, partial [Acidimicrobiaceae bacterium]|nr:hypothetical protein [Acidimicrobiaceae bacterium]